MSRLTVSTLQSFSWWFPIYSVIKWCSCSMAFPRQVFQSSGVSWFTPRLLQLYSLSYLVTQTQLSPQILFYSRIPTCHPYFLFFKLHLTTFLSLGYCTENLVIGSFLVSALPWSKYWYWIKVTLSSQTSFRRSELLISSPLFHFPCPCSCLPLFLHLSVTFPNQSLGGKDLLRIYLCITVLASSCNADSFFCHFQDWNRNWTRSWLSQKTCAAFAEYYLN